MADGQPSSQAQPTEQAQPRPSRRRDKPQLSCTLCRRRKLRCDRGEPCGTCVRRGLATSCAYVRSAGHPQQPSLSSPPPVVNNMTDRINQLEQLVTSLVDSNRNPGASGTFPSGSDRVSPVRSMLPSSPVVGASHTVDDAGRIRVENNETTYVPNTHWTVILDQITELKNMLANECSRTDRSASSAPASVGEKEEPDLLFGGHKDVSTQDILASVPPKSVVDRLVAGYFLDRPIVPVVLHGPTFLIEYERFWENPLGTPFVWIGLLFAVMCLVVSYRPEVVPMVSDPASLARAYREKIPQCLFVGKYAKGQPYSIETLLLYLNIEILRREDAQTEPLMMLGATVRLAYRMGYHRDASHFPDISPFQGEMRRRIWALIVQLDILTSAQVGLPRITRDDQADAAEPRNLLDEDLYHDMQELPPARPSAVQTEIHYTLSQSKLVSVCGRIVDWTGTLTAKRTNLSFAEADLARLNNQLDDTYARLPETLRMRSMAKSLVDNADTILRRISLCLHFQGAKCLLHYQFWSLLPSLLQGQQNDGRHRISHTTYIQAALQILQCQRILYDETQVAGRLYKDRWKVSSLLRNPCLMATAALCAELDKDHSGHADGSMAATHNNPSFAGHQNNESASTRAEIVQALHDSCLVWTHLSDTSSEASKAAEAVRTVLNKMHNKNFNISPTVETRSIMDFNLNSNSLIGTANGTSQTPSRVFDLLEQPTDGIIQNMHHDRMVAQPPVLDDLPRRVGLSEDGRLEYDPLASNQLDMSQQRVNQLQRMTKYFPKKFAFPI